MCLKLKVPCFITRSDSQPHFIALYPYFKLYSATHNIHITSKPQYWIQKRGGGGGERGERGEGGDGRGEEKTVKMRRGAVEAMEE